MQESSFVWHFKIFTILACTYIIKSQTNRDGTRKVGCQERSTSGQDYVGEANTTEEGFPCQKWSDTEPNNHSFTHVGDHNFCRNPDGDTRVWCYINDPLMVFGYCSVPFCTLKALDFSLDNDWKPDAKNRFTHAFLKKENLPSSFTICTAFMVEAWPDYLNAILFVLHDAEGGVWLWSQIYAEPSFTGFTIQFEYQRMVIF